MSIFMYLLIIPKYGQKFQLSAVVSLRLNGFLEEWQKDYKKAQTEKPSAQNLKAELKNLEEKQMRLLDAYLEQKISNEECTKAKEKIINRKVELKEKLNLGRKGNNWLEPFKEWILSAHQAVRHANTENLEEKRMFL